MELSAFTSWRQCKLDGHKKFRRHAGIMCVKFINICPGGLSEFFSVRSQKVTSKVLTITKCVMEFQDLDYYLTLQYWKLVMKDSVKFWKLCSNLTKHTWQPRNLRSFEPETHSFRMFLFDLPLWELKGKIGMKKGKLISSVLEYLLLTLKLVSSKKKLWKCFENFFFLTVKHTSSNYSGAVFCRCS